MLRAIVLGILAGVLVACSPHPGAGKWGATAENEWGIKEINLLFEGKAEFVSSKKDIAIWHCFWGGESKTVATMNCVPSTDTERRVLFQFVVEGENKGQFSHNNELIGTFERLPYEEKNESKR